MLRYASSFQTTSTRLASLGRRLPRLSAKRSLASSATSSPTLLSEQENGVVTLRFNDPKSYNAWKMKLLNALRDELQRCSADDEVKAVVLTGTDPYYSSGAFLQELLKPMSPAALRKLISENNENLFGMFLEFDKPIVAAVNGPAIGASVTSATLCDAIVASEKATFNVPFSRLGIVPEGCSSVHFAKLMGEEQAQRMLGPEGWVPTAEEALQAGLITKVVPHDELIPAAQAFAAEWAAAGKGKAIANDGLLDEYRAVNKRESDALADAILGVPFLEQQEKMASAKGKTQVAAVFKALRWTRPAWAMML